MTQKIKRALSLLLTAVLCFTTFSGLATTAYAAGEQGTAYLISFPRDGDEAYSGEWGHDAQTYMNGWKTGKGRYTTVYAMNSYTGNICYCIEPGAPLQTGNILGQKGEDFWEQYPSDYNKTISPETIKLMIGRIFQYGYTGTISTSWRSQNEGAENLSYAVATQLLIWETVVGERDADFNKVSTGDKNAILDQISSAHPLRDKIMSYYHRIEQSVQNHVKLPSFLTDSKDSAQTTTLTWDGSKYTATLTDKNNVLADYSFSADNANVRLSVDGNKLIITATEAPTGSVGITAERRNSQRRGIITWTDATYGPDSSIQDLVTFSETVSDTLRGYLNVKVSYGSAKIVKTSEDGKVEGISFTIEGNGVKKTVQTGPNGEIQIDNLTPGIFTVTEQNYDRYEPQQSQRVTVVAGQTATVTFNNTLKRGSLEIVKTSEDGLNEGVTFHLFGTSLSGLAVDEYAVSNSAGVARFENVLIGTDYVLEEVNTAIRYVVPEKQSAAIEWNEVTHKSFHNVLKKFRVTVTKSDSEAGTEQGDASLAGATYGIYQGNTLIDSYTTDKRGQFTTSFYNCGDDWTIRELSPSEGYLLNPTVYKVGAEPELYTIEYNDNPVYTPVVASQGKQTVKEYLEEWVENHGKANLRPSTFAGYKSHIKNHILPYIGHVQLNQLTPAMLDNMFQQLFDKGLSNSTVRYAQRILSVSMEHARKYHYIEHNPARDIITKFGKQGKTPDPYTIEQMQKFMSNVIGTEWEMPVVLAGMYGLRMSEIIGLRTTNIDLEKMQFGVVEQMPFNVPPGTKIITEMAPTKSNDRILPITEETLPYFLRQFDLIERQKELIAASGGVYYDNKLFIAKPDGSPQRRDRMSANFGQLIRHLEMPHIRFHDLRHTAATNMSAMRVVRI